MEVKIVDRRLVGKNSQLLISALGVWARQAENFPLNVNSFDEILIEKVDRVIQMVKDKFVLVPDDENIIRKTIKMQVRKSYTEHRHDLHLKFLEYEDKDIDMMSICPKDVTASDWTYLTTNLWISPEFKAKCERNKANRSKQVMGHTAGTCNFARLKEDKKEKGEESTRVTMFFETHTKKSDGTTVDEASKVVMTQMQDLREQVSQGVASYTDEEIFSQVMGPERHGRMRACGAGPTPTSYYGGQSSGNHHLQEKVNEQDMVEGTSLTIQGKSLMRQKRISVNTRTKWMKCKDKLAF